MNSRPEKFQLSVLATSLPLRFEGAIEQIRRLGFTHVDVVGQVERPPSHLDALADSGLLVSCVAIGRDLLEGDTLDAPSVATRRRAVDQIQRQIADAARLGATHCYVVPGTDAGVDGLTRFSETCCLLADFAQSRMVRLCVEHVPGRRLASAAATLEWLEEVAHPNLGLLVDVGHCLISAEKPAQIIEKAGGHLAYVHLDDNDGENDLHCRSFPAG